MTDWTQMGQQLAASGVSLDSLVVDLDETVWDWCYLVLRQPQFFQSHEELIYLRRPMIELLSGLQSAAPAGTRLRAWTAGYGHRLDQICLHAPELARLFGYDPRTAPAETQPHLATRLDFDRALRRDPTLLPRDGARWIGQKVPGIPTAAGKPVVEEAHIMLDDKEANCRRFVAAGEGRSALWLAGAPRIWKNNLRLVRKWAPPRRQWATGIAAALRRIAEGQPGVYTVEPLPSDHRDWTVPVTMDHRVVWREWIEPGRRIDRLTGRL